MLGHLIRKELLEHLLSLRFLILAGLTFLFTIFSLGDGALYYNRALADHRAASQATDARIRQIVAFDDRLSYVSFNWGEVFDLGYSVHKPSPVLSTFVRGLDPVLGRTARVVSTADRWLSRSPGADAPMVDFFPPADLGTIVKIVLSLFVLLLTYDALCGEKQSGTLRLLSSFPVPRHRVLVAKLIGVLLPVFATFLLPTIAGIAVVAAFSHVSLTGPEWMRLVVIVSTMLLYLGVIASAGLLASTLTQRPATSFRLTSFVVGGLAVVVVPRLSLILADWVEPAPSFAFSNDARNTARRELRQQRNQDMQEWLEDYEKDHGASYRASREGREAFYTKMLEAEMTYSPLQRKKSADLVRTFRNQQDAWLDTGAAIARISPAFALQNALVSLSGSGLGRHRRFLDAYLQYLYQEEDWKDATFTRDQIRRQGPPGKHPPFKWDVSDIPRFDYVDDWPSSDFLTALVDVGVLAGWGVVFFAAAWIRMLRYDLR